jgi:8-oxo-dGTP diphosphatase
VTRSDDAGRPLVHVVAAMIERDGRYLLTQRRSSAVLPLLWEFPGGKVERGEGDGVALAREVRHRLGVDVSVGMRISTVRHSYEAYDVELHLYECALPEGAALEPQSVHAFAWATSAEFEQYTFTPADERSMNLLLGFVVARASQPLVDP